MKTLYAAMARAFPEIEGASKDKTNPAFKSKYADLGSVMEAIKPALVKQGLFFSQTTHEQPGGVCIETVLHHESGEQMSFGKLFVPASKQDAQGYGSALTYARRYSLMTAFGVAPEDDDGNAAVASKGKTNGNKIDDAQWAALVQMLEATNSDAQRFCAYLKVPSLKELPAFRFDDAMAALQAKVKQPLKEQLQQSVQEAA